MLTHGNKILSIGGYATSIFDKDAKNFIDRTGLKKIATSLEVYFGEVPFFTAEYCIKLQLKDAQTNLLDVIEVKILKDDYLALGETKELRINAILKQQNIIKN